MTELRGIVQGDIRIFDIPPAVADDMRSEFIFENQKFHMLRRLGYSTAGVPEHIVSLAERSDGSMMFLRGTVNIIRSVLREHGYTVKFEDHRSDGRRLHVPRSILARARAYQLDAVEALVTSVQGYVDICMGGGKTILACCAAERLATSTIVLVHSTDLMAQWRDAIEEKMGIKAGTVGGGGKAKWSDQITIAMIQSLVELPPDDPHLAMFGLCVVDECHHVPAVTFNAVLRAIPARWRIGLSATPESRDDGLGPLVPWSFGKKLITITARQLIDLGYLMPAAVEAVPTRLDFAFKGHKSRRLEALRKTVVGDSDRNDLICDLSIEEVRKGESVAVLSNDIKHCHLLQGLCAARGYRGEVITSKVDKKLRKELITKVIGGQLRLVFATSLLDEGIDIPRLSCIVQALPQSSRIKSAQKMGRIMRPHEGKSPKIVDIVDVRIPDLVNRWLKRKAAYKNFAATIHDEEVSRKIREVKLYA